MTWRLGIDLGTNSLGWAALELERSDESWLPIGLIDSGVRIFSDGRNPKDKQSNAAKRREPRAARKNRDRYKRRRDRLMRQLIQYGLMPTDKAERKALEGGKKGDLLAYSDPWVLRARALNVEITPHQLGRAVFHLHQRRGFKSNRKTDRGDNESGKVHDATKRTLEKLEEEGTRTLGELFGKPRFEVAMHNAKAAKGEGIPQPKARVRKTDQGANWQYDYYPTRELILSEFDYLWEAQTKFHAGILTDDARDALRNTIEWQHPLKAQPVGKCTFITELQLLGFGGNGNGSPEDIEKRKELERAPRALPSSQRVRIFQEINALKFGSAGAAKIPLTKEQRNLIVDRMVNPTKFQHPTTKTGKLIFNKMKSILDQSTTYDKFNTESENEII